MTQLIVNGTAVLADATGATPDSQGWKIGVTVYPNNQGFSLVDTGAALPADWGVSVYQWQNNALVRVGDAPGTLAAAQVTATAAVADYYTNYTGQGCPINFASYGNPNALLIDGTSSVAGQRVLQTRDDEDRINWLILGRLCDYLISSSQGSTPVQLRTADNAIVALPASTCEAVLLAMLNRGAAIMGHAWTLKNSIAQAPTVAAVNAVNITAGWPA